MKMYGCLSSELERRGWLSDRRTIVGEEVSNRTMEGPMTPPMEWTGNRSSKSSPEKPNQAQRHEAAIIWLRKLHRLARLGGKKKGLD